MISNRLGVSVAAALILLNGCTRQEPVDLLLVNGKVLTVDEAFSIASAVAVKDGLIVAVGDESVARRYRAANRIDLAGRVLMPGFNDNHVHPGSRPRHAVDAAVDSIAELKERVRAKAQELGPGEWITGYGWDEARLAEQRNVVRADLDEAAPNNPVALSRAGGHSVVGNSLALKVAGIDRNTPKPLRGVIERDSNGEPNGIIRERVDLYLSLVPADSEESLKPGYLEHLQRLPALGLTSINVAAVSLRDEVTEQLRPEQPSLGPTYKTLREIYAEHGADLPRATVQIGYPGAEALASYPYRTGAGNDRIKLGAIGEAPAVDGGFTGPTAWTTEDYNEQPGFRGQAFFDEEDLQTLADDVAKNGWQLGLHAIGDAAIDMAVKVYAEALRKRPMADHRWYLAHFTMLPSDETLEIMREQGILGAAQPNFLYTLENRYLQTLSGRHLEHINPVGVPLERGVILSFGSDNLPLDPRVGLYSAITRKGRSGERVYGPEEAVSIEQAIRAYTVTTAYFNHDETKKGSLEAGKFADMIVLDRDPLAIAPEELLTMNVDMTIIGGKIVYERARP